MVVTVTRSRPGVAKLSCPTNGRRRHLGLLACLLATVLYSS